MQRDSANRIYTTYKYGMVIWCLTQIQDSNDYCAIQLSVSELTTEPSLVSSHVG